MCCQAEWSRPKNRHLEAIAMFLAHCNRCGRRELRSVRAISSLANTPRGVELHFRCATCGTSQRMLTGSNRHHELLRAG
jgi:hypothetical protein